MSEGLKTLLEAAQYIEQQEKLKLSPPASAIPAILNEQQRFIVHAFDAAAAAAAANTTTTTNGHHLNNNNIVNGGSNSQHNNINNSINIRNSYIRHANAGSLQVSSSAPAAAATFQHVNGHHQQQHHTHHSQQQHHPHNPISSNSSHATTPTVLSNGTNTIATTNGHHNPLHHHLNNQNHQQQQQHHHQNSQLLNANHHDYEFNGNGSITVVATSSSSSPSSGATSGNLTTSAISATSLNGRSSEGRISEDTKNNNNNVTTPSTSFMLLGNATTSKLSATSLPLSATIQQQQHEQLVEQNQNLLKSKSTTPATNTTSTTFTLIDSNGEIVRNAAASKQMLLANGIRIASPAATIGQQQQVVGLSSKAINIPLNINNKTIPLITGYPYQVPTQLNTQLQMPNASGSGGGTILSNRHKTITPLTPPPMSSRKFVEPTQSRIRSFSLSSHKFSANHQMNVQNLNNNSNNSMMVDDIPPTQQHSGYTNSSSSTTSSQHSPPRHASGGASSLGSSLGSHYMHMQAGATGGNHVGHVTPRRRTISSTSNGAGTREVHNKLEKNRRAHLKECYEALKNQLSLKDEDRRKTSNLAILGEALKCVQSFQKRNAELEAEWEHLANDKINFQKRIVSLKRELGPKYEQIFSGIFPDIEIGSIPSERETINDTHSLSSGRGSTLYSSSSSLSSGGSNGSSSGSNTMSSPVGAGLQTAMPTAISPVITKINNINSNKINNININNINSTSPISITSNNVVMHQQRKTPTINTTIQAVAIPTTATTTTQGGGGISIGSPPAAGSPTTLVTFGSSLPLSLTAKNISATAVTRGSPTPSTPSPSPSSSSGVSSSSSLISTSPPINGVINNGRNVTVNIPNGLKLQAATAAGVGLNGGGGVGGMGGANTLAGTIGNGTASAAATIIATSVPAQGVNNTNNAVLGNHQQQQQQHHNNGRKKSLTLCNNINNTNNNNNVMENTLTKIQQHHQQYQQQQTNEDGEQPAKFLKVFNTTANGLHQDGKTGAGVGQKMILTGNCGGGGAGIIGGVLCGGNNHIVGSSTLTATTNNSCKSITNGSSTSSTGGGSSITTTTTSTNELCRLPGGAELNILPSNGLKGGPMATAFYHANGKITFVNGPPPNHQQQQSHQHHHPPSPLPNTSLSSNGTTVTNGFLLKDATGITPLLVSAASSPTSNTTSVNGLHFAGNFAQLLAAANNTSTTNSSTNSNNIIINNNNNITTSCIGSANVAAASILPIATNFQNVSEMKTKNNSKSSIVTWRSGAATTN